MNLFETIGFLYIVLASIGFTLIFVYIAFCGLRSYVEDARTGAAYRSEDEEFRKVLRGIDTRKGVARIYDGKD